MLRSLLTVRCDYWSIDVHKPFSYLTKVIGLKVVRITTRDDDVMKTRVVFDMLKDNLPSSSTRFLWRLRNSLCVSAHSI
jgi:hypothetical protein